MEESPGRPVQRNALLRFGVGAGVTVGEYRFHKPTEPERAFLRLVTFGYPELAAQIENCEVDDFDLDGYCDIRIMSGPPSATKNTMYDGPSLVPELPYKPSIETILWVDDSGYLSSVEVIG